MMVPVHPLTLEPSGPDRCWLFGWIVGWSLTLKRSGGESFLGSVTVWEVLQDGTIHIMIEV